MKIFNWVHRRFNNKAENVKNSDGEDQQFPEENKCNHVFERWRGGILAIGTLGYDPLKDLDEQVNDYLYQEEEVHDSDDESSEDFGEEEEVESVEEEEKALVDNAEGLIREAEGLMEEMEENWKHEFKYVMMEKKERVTLADLFHDDDDDVSKKQTMSKADNLSKEKSNRKRRRLLFRNNLIAKDARPIHKLNQLMRRMLKRKIHPDVGPINSVNTTTHDDYASLLPVPTRDANI